MGSRDMGSGGTGGSVSVPQEQAQAGPLVSVVMGHEGTRQRAGDSFASFAGKEGGGKHRYLMPYKDWVAADRPTIITVTVTEGLPG